MDIALADCVNERYRFSTESIRWKPATTGLEPARSLQEDRMVITAAHLSPILSIVFGILILIVPRFLNYFVAIYLILAGLLGLGILR
jgi:Protein of unknown function (DUF3096)